MRLGQLSASYVLPDTKPISDSKKAGDAKLDGNPMKKRAPDRQKIDKKFELRKLLIELLNSTS